MQPVETTLYSLSNNLPAIQPDRRDGERHMTLYRVGSLVLGKRRELCLIKNISGGGMMVRVYSSLKDGEPVSVELKSGQPISGKVNWIREQHVGIAFDQPVDVIDILSSSMEGPRPRMPRIEIDCFATLREGAQALRVRACDISQGGVKVRCDTVLAPGTDVVITLPDIAPQAGVVRWNEGPFTGVTFNRVLAFGELVDWLRSRRHVQRAAG